MPAPSGRTPRLQLPYPTPDDDVDVPRDVQALAMSIDGGAVLYIGEVRFMALQATPAGWLPADGAAVSRSTYSLLYGVIGVTYGSGDGSTTFNTPPVAGRALVGAGQGAGLTARPAGSRWGNELEAITAAMIGHTHTGAAPDHLHGAGGLYAGNHAHGGADTASMGASVSVQSLAGGPLVLARGAGAGGEHTHGIYAEQPGVGGSTGAADRGLGFTTSQPSVVSGAGQPNSQPSLAIPAFIYAGA